MTPFSSASSFTTALVSVLNDDVDGQSFIAQFLVGCFEGKNDHRNVAGAYKVNSKQWSAVLGSRYVRIRDILFVCASDTFKPGTVTKAWVLRNGVDPMALSNSLYDCMPVASRKSHSRRRKDIVTTTSTEGIVTGQAFDRETEAIANKSSEQYRRHNDDKYGRRWAVGTSFQNLSKVKRRHMLAGSGLVDIDMKNAHPSILSHITGGCIESLEALLDSREEMLASDPDMKVKILKTLNGGRVTKGSHSLLLGIKAQQKDIRDICSADPLAAEMGLVWETSQDQRRSVALLMQAYEDLYLHAMEQWANANDIKVRFLMFDGMCCDGLTASQLSKMQAYANEQTGMDITLVIKEKY